MKHILYSFYFFIAIISSSIVNSAFVGRPKFVFQEPIHQLQDSSVDLIVRKIHTGKPEEAWKDFQQINNENTLRTIISTAYDDTTFTTNMEIICSNIVQFIRVSPKYRWKAISLNEFRRVIVGSGINRIVFYELYKVFFDCKSNKPDGLSSSEVQTLADDFKILLTVPGGIQLRTKASYASFVFMTISDLEEGNFHSTKISDMLEDVVKSGLECKAEYADQIYVKHRMYDFIGSLDMFGRGTAKLVKEMDICKHAKNLLFYDLSYQMICDMRKRGKSDKLHKALTESSMQKCVPVLEVVSKDDDRCLS